ncbi:MAG: M23 family metallopeptidase [Ferruginibacter sp.]
MKLFFKAIKIISLFALLLIITIAIFLYCSTSVTTNLDSFEYGLPYAIGTKHRVVQGYGGLFSHQHVAAIDFEMPVGTPVYASRAGTIYSYKDDSDEGGPFPDYKNKANYIIIKQEDGSFGCYWHLQKNGVLIKSGYVEKGQQIVLSGATGQVLNPHLHFSVKRQLNYEMNSFLRTKFKTTAGDILLKNGEVYERPKD